MQVKASVAGTGGPAREMVPAATTARAAVGKTRNFAGTPV
jgi:hypothetical protein